MSFYKTEAIFFNKHVYDHYDGFFHPWKYKIGTQRNGVMYCFIFCIKQKTAAQRISPMNDSSL